MKLIEMKKFKKIKIDFSVHEVFLIEKYEILSSIIKATNEKNNEKGLF